MKTYTVKEAAKVLNVSIGKIRQWEKELNGILVIPRSKQGARYYTDDEISLLETVKQMHDKNLSKDMIRALLEDKFLLKKEATPFQNEVALTKVNSNETFERVDTTQDFEKFIQSMEIIKTQLVDEIKNEIRTNIRKDFIDEMKKEISKGSVQIVKSLSDSIYKSNEKTREEIEELSSQLNKSTEVTSESLQTLSKRIVKATKGTSEQIRGLSNRLAESSDAASEEFKTMIHYISSSAEVTHTEISSLIETLNTDRETYIEAINLEREKYWKDVNRRELMFQDLLVSFRSTAVSMEKKKTWWKIWQKN